MKISISFFAEEIKVKPVSKNGVSYVRAEAAGINAKEVLQALWEADGIDLDELAEVMGGKDAIMEWASENSPKGADWHIRQQSMNYR